MKHLFLTLAFAITVSSLRAQTTPTYHVLSKTVLGGEGFWDYLIVDPDARRLYVTHDTRIEVLDVDTKKTVGTITVLPGHTG